jgi:hypothetical protein
MNKTFYRIMSVLFLLLAGAFGYQVVTASGAQQVVAVFGMFWMGGRGFHLASKGWGKIREDKNLNEQ